jgi:2-hydroxy-6-oxonona-2,4-dienedioate hydrolase
MIAYPFGAGSVTTRVIEAGSGDDALVLVHGFTSRADRWLGNIDQLAALGYRVVAPDLPGHGFASKDPAFDHSVGGYRDFILTLLDGLRIRRAVMVGTSLGGHVLADLACRAPERVEKLVMIGSMGLQALSEDRVAAIRKGLEDMSAGAVRTRLLTVFSNASLVTDDLVREDVRVNTSPGAQESLQVFGRYLAERFNGDLVLDRLAAIDGRVPLLLLWGDQDRSAPVAIAEAARGRLPNARLAVMAGVNHTPYMENPLLFRAILGAFLKDRLAGFSAPGVALT